MSVQLKVPSVGESVTEVEIGEWLKKEGDHVEKDENVVVIETDKATVEIPAPQAGRLSKILKKQGEGAVVGDVIGELEAGSAAAPEAKKGTPSSKPASDVARDVKKETSKPNVAPDVRRGKSEEKVEPTSEVPPHLHPAPSGASTLPRRGEGTGHVMPAAQRVLD